MGVLHQPHGINTKIKRVSRLVVLPDYQGVGIGYKFLNVIAKLYTSQGFDFTIVTSAKNLIMKLSKSPQWAMYRLGTSNCSSPKSKIDFNRASARSLCKTAGFKYRG
jgi:GNAT superfamily N-acetyltransferase